MFSIYGLINYEEGWRPKPYLCSEDYPTVGWGFRIGPKGADIKLYQFTLPQSAGDAWLDEHLKKLNAEMRGVPHIAAALDACAGSPARLAVLQSMAYQMGVPGLAAFKNTLKDVAQQNWNSAATGMLDSRWAKQTPGRARRHAEQMRTGEWAKEYGV